MEHLVEPTPLATDIIRTPVSGPKPANTLAFIQCRASGADIATFGTDLVQFEVQFKSQFRIDGYLQAKHDWYLANTFISPTGMLRILSTTTDFEFVIALDSVDPFIDLDGVVGFNCRFGLQLDGIGFTRSGSGELDMVCNICAYILLFEPEAERPASGQSQQKWNYSPATLAAMLPDLKVAKPARAASSTERADCDSRRMKKPRGHGSSDVTDPGAARTHMCSS